MAYLEVTIENGTWGGKIATNANGYSLGKNPGCLGWMFGTNYPKLTDYIDALEYEGWDLVSSGSSGAYGMIDGLPFNNVTEKLYFRGRGRYRVTWDSDGWKLTDDD